MANSPNCSESPQKENCQRQLECINQINSKLLFHWKDLCKENFKELQNMEQQLEKAGNKLIEKRQAIPYWRARKQACSDCYESFITKLKDACNKLDHLTKEANHCKIKTTPNNDTLNDMLMKLKTEENDIKIRIEEITNRNNEDEWDRLETPCSLIKENGKGENPSVPIDSAVFGKETQITPLTTLVGIGQGDDCVKGSFMRKDNDLTCSNSFQHSESTSSKQSVTSSETSILKTLHDDDSVEPVICERSNNIIVHYTSQDIKAARELQDSSCCTPSLVIVDNDYSTTDTSEDTTPNQSLIPLNYRNMSELDSIYHNCEERETSSEQYMNPEDISPSTRDELVSESRRQFPSFCSDFEQSTANYSYHDNVVTKTVLPTSELKSYQILPLTRSPNNGEVRDDNCDIAYRRWSTPTQMTKSTKSNTNQIRVKERKAYEQSKLDACIVSTTDLKMSRNIDKRKTESWTTINRHTGILPPIERTHSTNTKSDTNKMAPYLLKAQRMTNCQNKHGTDKHICCDLKNVDSENSVPSIMSYISSGESLIDVEENIANDVHEIGSSHGTRFNNSKQHCNNSDPFCIESVDTKANDCGSIENETLSLDSDTGNNGEE